MDEVIFEEFKGTGNMELHLDRTLVDKASLAGHRHQRVGTRREEMLMDRRGASPRLHPPPRAQRHESGRRHGTARQPDAAEQDQ